MDQTVEAGCDDNLDQRLVSSSGKAAISGKKNHALDDNKQVMKSVPENYDPFAMFKMGVKSSKDLLSADMMRAEKDNLPEWIRHPKFIEYQITSNATQSGDKLLHSLSIHQSIVKNLEKDGIAHLFPVQTSIIPLLLHGIECGLMSRLNDICVCSPTGSGKTLSFAVPIVHYMIRRQPRDTRALILVPTVELANQVYEIFLSLCKGENIHCALLGGGQVDNEILVLSKKSKFGFVQHPQVVVSTPGRLAHILEVPDALCLKNLRFLVIDEADRIMDLIKQSWLGKLKEKIPSWQPTGRVTLQHLCEPQIIVQKLLFSATLNPDPEKLKDLELFQPRLFIPKIAAKNEVVTSARTAKYTIPNTLSEYTVQCKTNLKPLFVVSLLAKLGVKKALCFTGSAESARRLHFVMKYYVENDVLKAPCLEFSSLLPKKARKRNLSEFTSRAECFLVASDAAARGIDAVDIEVIVIYDMPQYIEAYIHRAGRASRAGKEGSVYSLVSEDDVQSFKKLFKRAGLKVPQDYKTDNACISDLSVNYENALSYAQRFLQKR